MGKFVFVGTISIPTKGTAIERPLPVQLNANSPNKEDFSGSDLFETSRGASYRRTTPRLSGNKNVLTNLSSQVLPSYQSKERLSKDHCAFN
jgi:hypothetical protein